MSGKSRRAKGHAYERQIASDFRDWGFEARTTRSLRGGYQGDQDVVLPDYWLYAECKAVESGSVPQWMTTLMHRAPAHWLRVLFWKRDGRGRNGGEWVIMPKEDFKKLFREGCDQFWRGRSE